MPETLEHENEHIVKLTKKYIIDFMNTLFFSQRVLWDSDDQYNELPILKTTIEGTGDSEYKQEQRSALLVHKSSTKILRLSICVIESSIQSLCYRLTGLKKEIKIDKIHYPLDGVVIDLSISDLNIGLNEVSSFSFCDNTSQDGSISNSKLFTLLSFLLNCYIITFDNEEIFADLIDETLSLPPVVSDPHYISVFGMTRNENSI